MLDKNYFEPYMQRFLAENQKINLISKNEENFLWEKHVFDSLSIEKFFAKYVKNLSGKKVLDIGTGGGFPSVPLAIAYPELKIFALDSTAKKLRAIENICQDLNINNLQTICVRAEKHHGKYDIITSRAVGKLNLISGYALPLLKKGGYFVAYKSKLAQEEIMDAEKLIAKLSGKICEVIRYDLPMSEPFERNLIIIEKTT